MGKSLYQNRFLIEETSSLTETGSFNPTDAASSGVAGTNNFVMLLNNNPVFESGFTQEYTSKDYNTSYRYLYDYTASTYKPTTSYTFDANAYTLDLPLRSLFQSGVSSSSGVYTAVPYTSSTLSTYLSLLNYIDDSSSERIDGAICSVVSLSGSSGGAIAVDAKFIGSQYTDNIDLSSDTISERYIFQNSYLFQNIAFKWNAASNLDIESFTITISNNAEPKFGIDGSQTCYTYLLGELTVSGTIQVSWDTITGGHIDDIFSETDSVLNFYFGEDAADFTVDNQGELLITLRILNESVNITRQDEQFLEFTFQAVHGTTTPITMKWKV